MFHRRLLLLAAVILVVMLVLVGQLGRLTLAKGAELRDQAESRLVIWDWLPTSRGRILDRKGRVLAQDRPSFEVSVDFRVITGEWAVTQAARAAKRAHAGQWFKLAPSERQAIAKEYIPIFQAHADSMWERVARISGTDLATLEERREEIITKVERRSSSIVNRRLERQLEARLAVGEEITAATEEEVRRQVDAPIAESRSPHTVLSRVDDTIAFELMRLMEQNVDIAVPVPGGGSEARSVPLLPGLSVDHAGDREYPFDTVRVGVDLATLPGPLARPGSVLEIDAKGVAYHILGRVDPGFNGDRRRSDGEVTPGHRERRRDRLRTDEAFAERVLTPADQAALPRRLDRGEYRDDDLAGQGGIEESQEIRLRGLRGLKISELETGRDETIPSVRGADVHLAFDVMLQARVQAAMSAELGLAVAQEWHGHENPTLPVGTTLNGAAVVIDIDSGDILAMVSTPTIPREAVSESASAIFSDPWNKAVNVPWLDRTVAVPYPPGSIAKAIILVGAVGEGKLNLDIPIDCGGFLFPNKPDQFRCWAFKQYHTTHTDWLGHEPNGPEALMVSCNIYFFTLGQRLGGDGIIRTYRMFGLGKPWHLGLGERLESPGFLGTRPNGLPAHASDPGHVGIQDAIQMGIGQGPVAWTPLHAADAFATLGRGGVRITPHILAPEGTPEVEDLHLNPRAVKESLEGLALSVNDDRGTGHHVTIPVSAEQQQRVPHFQIPGVQVWGKTGTAQAPSIFAAPGDPLYASGLVDPAKPDGPRALRAGDHSWFVVLVGREGEGRPRYAISVMMEYAGSGGKVSGPIAAQIIHALRAEGYL